MQQKIVLVIDDNKGIHQSLAMMTGRTFPIVFIAATTLVEAKLRFQEHIDTIDAVLMDGCIESRECDTLPLLEMISRSRYHGPVIAISGDRHNRQLMVLHGASGACDKHEVRDKLEEMLLTPAPKRHVPRR